MSISLLTNLVLFNTLDKATKEVNHLRELTLNQLDLNLVQKEFNIELLTEHIDLVNSSRIIQDLKK